METKIDLAKVFRLCLETRKFIKKSPASTYTGYDIEIEKGKNIVLFPVWGYKGSIHFMGLTQSISIETMLELIELYDMTTFPDVPDEIENFLIERFGNDIIKQ
ncbi:MAG: hypothetical protein PHT07_21575 [Paludibacter sp.]|nr:hypothetical protein [Paludibacter sp.]